MISGVQWQRDAVCYRETSAAPELWTPDKRPGVAVRRELERMCHRCPVRRTCATEAVSDGAEAGMYAGVWVPELKTSTAARWHEAMAALREIGGEAVEVSAA